MKFFLLLLCFLAPLYSAEIDRNVTSFEKREQKKIDRFDFSGCWPNMETIDIDAKRKKRVELDLTGNYPLLETVNFEGGFGLLNGEITGEFPKLTLLNVLCGSCRMVLDLTSQWKRSCEINVRGSNEDVRIVLPADVGLIVHTKIGMRGHVRISEDLKKKGFGLFKKNYRNALADTSEIVLELNVEVGDATIYLTTEES